MVDATDLIKSLTLQSMLCNVKGMFVRIRQQILLKAVIRRLIILST